MMAITHDQSIFTPVEDDDRHRAGQQFRVRKIDYSAPIGWLRRGWSDFRRIPGLSLLYGLLSVAGCYLMYFYARESVALMLGLFSGLLLGGPFLAVGLYAAAREMEVGSQAAITTSLRTIRGAFWRVTLAGLLLMVIYIVWLRVSSILVALHYQAFRPDTVQLALSSLDWGTLSVLALYLGIGFLFAGLVFVTTAVSLPLMLDRDCDPVTAVLTSMRAVSENRGPMLLWAALITVSALVALATAFLGFAVLFPVFGYATWHSYRDLVESL